jgi:hypothetical protein
MGRTVTSAGHGQGSGRPQYQVERRFHPRCQRLRAHPAALLKLETPSNFPVRGAIFTHIEDGIARLSTATRFA